MTDPTLELGTVAIDVLGKALKRRACQPIDLDTGNIKLEISIGDFRRFSDALRKARNQIQKEIAEKGAQLVPVDSGVRNSDDQPGNPSETH